MYIKLPFLGKSREDLVDFFIETLKKFTLKWISNFTLEMNLLLVVFFIFYIIYKYIRDACQATYYGSTVKQSKVGFSQHFGKSHRTSLPISKPLQFSIRDHCLNNDHTSIF